MPLPQLPDLQELEQLFQEAYSAFISGRANAISTIQNTYNELNNYFNQLFDNCTIYQNIQAKLADYKDYLNNYTNNIISPMSYTIENVPTILDESTSPTLQNICEECLCYDDNSYIKVKYETYLESLRTIQASVDDEISFIAQRINDAIALRDYISEKLLVLQNYIDTLASAPETLTNAAETLVDIEESIVDYIGNTLSQILR